MSNNFFEQTFQTAINAAEEVFKRVENLPGGYHPTYKPLFRKLWLAEDPNQTGYFTHLDQCKTFARNMVANNWREWEPKKRDLELWEAMLAIHKRISIMEFALINEDPNFPMPEPAQITAAHEDWKKQGGSDPSKPTSGFADVQVIDWSQPDKNKLAQDVMSALKADGFLLLKNHGIPYELVSHLLWMSREFFARRRKAETANQVEAIRVKEATRPQMKCARGYSDFYQEALNPKQGPDIKETFDYSLQKEEKKSGIASANQATSCTMHLGLNLWPQEEGKNTGDAQIISGPTEHVASPYGRPTTTSKKIALAPPGFREACEKYLEYTYKLAKDLLEIICKGLNITDEVAKKEILAKFEDPLFVQRLIHYTPQPTEQNSPQPPRVAPAPYPGQPTKSPRSIVSKEPEQTQMGAGSHVDFGALTILFEDAPGLEVQRRGHPDAPYHAIRHVPGAAIINTGYVLEKLTNGLLKATRHRVQNKNASDRYSLASFYDPNPESMIAPLKEFVVEGAAVSQPYEPCKAGHKGVRFGKPEYLKLAAERP